MKKFLVFFFSVFLVACGEFGPVPETRLNIEVTREVEVEVTREVEVEVTREVEVEVTREVEVEVTREVEVVNEVQVVVTATPRPTPRPTSTPKPSSPFSNAVPCCEVGTITSSLRGDTWNYNVKVLDFVRGDEAWNRIVAANRFNEPAPDGMEWALVHVEVELIAGSVALELDRYDFGALTRGRLVGIFDLNNWPCCLVNEVSFTLFDGGVADGWIALGIYTDDPNPIMVLGGANGVGFHLVPDTSNG